MEVIVRMSKIEKFCKDYDEDPLDYILGMVKLSDLFKVECKTSSKIDKDIIRENVERALDAVEARPHWKEFMKKAPKHL